MVLIFYFDYNSYLPIILYRSKQKKHGRRPHTIRSYATIYDSITLNSDWTLIISSLFSSRTFVVNYYWMSLDINYNEATAAAVHATTRHRAHR